MATRYSDKTKQEVVDFVKAYDAEHGRGGESAAKKKYKINPISIKKWCVEAGYNSNQAAKPKQEEEEPQNSAPESSSGFIKPGRG